MINQTIQEVEDKEFLYWKDLKEALERLEKNKDFQRVILESLLASPQIKRNGARSDVMEALIAISQLEDFFITIRAMGEEPEEDEENEMAEE